MKRASSTPAKGERRALIGFVPQYRLCAELTLAALVKGRLKWIKLLSDEAGRIDDFLIASQGRLDAYQVKYGEQPRTYTLNELLAPQKKKNGEKGASWLQQLADGWRLLLTAYSNREIHVHLVLRGIGSRIGAINGIPVSLRRNSFQQFLTEGWRAAPDSPTRSKWKTIIEVIADESKLLKSDFERFRLHCHVDFLPTLESTSAFRDQLEHDHERDIEDLKA